jgi:hypothetical protein
MYCRKIQSKLGKKKQTTAAKKLGHNDTRPKISISYYKGIKDNL